MTINTSSIYFVEILMKTKRLLLSVVFLFSLSACGYTATQATSETTLTEKAAKAIGVNAVDLRVVPNSQQGSLQYLKYQVLTPKGDEYICFYEVAGMITSSGRGMDATCAKLSFTKSNHK